METACADVAHVSRLNTFVGREWGRLPGSRGQLDGVHVREGTQSDGPQGMSVIKLGHFTEKAG
jgi:hypothetical protein